MVSRLIGVPRALGKERQAQAKARLLDLLRNRGITHAEIDYDGYGDSGRVEHQGFGSSSPIIHPSGSFNFLVLIFSNSAGVTSMMTDGQGIPLAGAGPKCKGITPDGTVFSFTSRSLIGSAGTTSTSALSVRRNTSVSPAST